VSPSQAAMIAEAIPATADAAPASTPMSGISGEELIIRTEGG
jgi:hypothetical protein